MTSGPPGPAPNQPTEIDAIGEPSSVRGRAEAQRQLVRCGRTGRPIHREDLVCSFDGPPTNPAVDLGSERVQLQLKRRHQAEVRARTTHRPEQIGLIVRRRGDPGAVGEDDVEPTHVVACQTVAAHQVTEPTSERQAGHAGVRDDTPRWLRARGPGMRCRRHATCTPARLSPSVSGRRPQPVASARGRSSGRRRRPRCRRRCGRHRGCWRESRGGGRTSSPHTHLWRKRSGRSSPAAGRPSRSRLADCRHSWRHPAAADGRRAGAPRREDLPRARRKLARLESPSSEQQSRVPPSDQPSSMRTSGQGPCRGPLRGDADSGDVGDAAKLLRSRQDVECPISWGGSGSAANHSLDAGDGCRVDALN